MTDSVVTATTASSVRAVAELMRERNVGSVVLVEDGRPVGFVTDRDLAVSVLADGPAVEVDVTPAERQHFAPPHSGRKRDHQWPIDASMPDRIEKQL